MHTENKSKPTEDCDKGKLNERPRNMLKFVVKYILTSNRRQQFEDLDNTT